MTTPTQVYGQGRPLAQEYMPDIRAHLKQLAHVTNGAMFGQTNNSMQVTLNPSATSTTIVDSRISIQTAVQMIPMTAHAATAQLAGIYVIPSAGQAVIHHASAAATDQTFMVSIIG